jgi:hypothetical protein
MAEKIKSQLTKSLFYRKLVGGDAINYRHYNNEDIALYLAIVDSARKRVKNLYPESEFHVLLWENDALDKDGTLAKQMLKGLRDKRIIVHRIDDILPGSANGKAEYYLGGWDLHPNAMADDRIAEYVVHNILKQK